ncbi:unnamed protein product [Moneuplotes crassus]|uniref:Uncharacterized protein n=1 Tax=Euplotes crassus TaxID=5936 RepID=A0AAD2DB32_EUPCR|nr:unnamed protein product [Moneuplotes crassus]
MVWIRPFETVSNNIIECMNQLTYTFLITPFFFMTTKEDWTAAVQDTYIYLLLMPSIIASVINMYNLKRVIMCCKNKKKETKVRPYEPPNHIANKEIPEEVKEQVNLEKIEEVSANIKIKPLNSFSSDHKVFENYDPQNNPPSDKVAE